MNGIAISAALLCGAICIPAVAQVPASGVRLHLQLLSADTGVVAVPQDSGVLTSRPRSMFFVQCVRPDSGKRKRESPECGPRVRSSALKLLAETTVTTDEHGHARERLSWAGGDAVAEVDASDRSVIGSEERMRLRIGFWPRLSRGAPAPEGAAVRMTAPKAPFGKSIQATVLFKDGAQILIVEPER